jgi:predicted MPP superfamily phosphohydrolase
MRRAAGLLVLAVVLALLVTGFAFWEASSRPIMRELELRVVKGPPFPGPIRIAFLSDTHLAGPDNGLQRMRRLVADINATKPDIVLLGGDYVGEPELGGNAYSLEETVSAFAGFRARLGVFAVLGNHDHWHGADKVRKALANVGVISLANQAVVRGPMVIGGIDDDFTRSADVKATVRAVRSAGGVPIYFSHSPDLFGLIPSGNLLLAGHTHCGQIVIPLIGSPWIPSQFGNLYRCGKHRNESRMVVVTAGIATTGVPLRLGAPPDWWLITVKDGGPHRRSRD